MFPARKVVFDSENGNADNSKEDSVDYYNKSFEIYVPFMYMI